jgi:RNA methyltransferase, TrmH family
MKPTISSPHNPKIKGAIHLRDSRQRRRAQQLLIDGPREVAAAVQAGIELVTLFYTPAEAPAEVASLLASQPAEILQPVAPEVFEKLCYGQRSSGVVAVARAPELPLDRLQLPAEPLVLVLDRAEKPGNVGAVLRTASAAGVDAVILCQPQCEVFNPNAIRASLGTIFSVPIAVTDFPQLTEWLDQRGVAVKLACVGARQSLWQTSLRGPLALVFGSEAHGLGQEWNRQPWQAISIPMVGAADSLNLSISAAVVCYEAVRQRADGG